MAFADYWKRLRDKNPGLAGDNTKLTITVANFRKALSQSFDHGKTEGEQEATSQVDDSLFGRIFGPRSK